MSLRTVGTLLAGLACLVVMGAPKPGPPAIGGARPAGSQRLLSPLTAAIVTQPFGCTAVALEPIAPRCPGGHFHSGLDLAAADGTPVRAAAAGVATVANDPGGYGLYVVIEHGGGLATLYGHLAAALVQPGARVGAGQEVGRVGSSGLSTGPHLHFEVRRTGRPEDPATYLRAS